MKRIQYVAWLCVFFMTSDQHARSVEPHEVFLGNIEQRLRDPNYPKKELPKSFALLLDLLRYAKTTDYPLTYTNSLFKVFNNLLKGSEYVNPYAFIEFLDAIPSLMQDYFIAYKVNKYLRSPDHLHRLSALGRLQESFSVILYDSFISGYCAFKQDPDKFLQELALNTFILAEEEISIQVLRNSFIKFIDLAINKLVWSITDPLSAWQTTKAIAEKLTELERCNAIDDIEDLDDLFWSLTHRFCFFVDLESHELPLTFYEAIKKELDRQQFLFLDLEEQASFLESKRSCLTRTLLTFEAKVRMTVKL